MKGKCVETLVHADVATIISNINRHFRLICFHMIKPKLVTQPAIVHGFCDTSILTPAANDPDWPAVG